MKKTLLISFFSLGLIFSCNAAQAAMLNLIGDKDAYPINQEFGLDVKIDSEGEGINGAQATVQFDRSILEAVKADKIGSIFDFWLTEPVISNAEGKISFIAASTTGFTGKSLQVLRVTFRPKGPAKSTLVFSDAAITAADGSGKNVLTKTNGLALTFTAASGVAEGPAQITRPAEAATGFPKKPAMTVALYPDPAKWNNVSAKFFANWTLPGDVTGVAAVLNKVPNSAPAVSEGLFEAKSFPPLEDGIHYLHVRFRNSIGWSETSHYKIATDSAPPSISNIILDGKSVVGLELVGVNAPTPEILYTAKDALSGIDHYEIAVDGNDAVATKTSSYTLPLQIPGKHILTLKALDVAGNTIEARVNFEIIPIESPKIGFISKDVFIGEGGLIVSGTYLAGHTVNIDLVDGSGRTVFHDVRGTDANGNWNLSIDTPLKQGKYFVEAVGEDDRGALSLAVRSDIINAHERPIFTLGGLEVTKTWLIFILMVLIAFGAWLGTMTYRMRQLQVSRRVTIAQRDVIAMSSLIRQDVEKMSALLKSTNLKDTREQLKLLIGKVEESSQKMTKYIVDNIGEIKD